MTLEDEIINHRKFLNLVEEMRNHQRAWFDKKDIDDLTASKSYERKVDEAIRRFREKQLELL